MFCRIPIGTIYSTNGPDAIPALTNPPLVAADHENASYLSDQNRVVGLLVDGSAYAFPLNVLRWHENVNIDVGGEQLAVSYCPLTGTALTFDRSVVDGAELGVSGLLFRNNLVLYERGSEQRSFFPQMLRSAQCGPLARQELQLPMVASWEMRWDAWKDLFPDTRVLSRETGFDRNYEANPNAEYEQIDNPRTLFPVEPDTRRLPKERVLGIPTSGDGGPAYPFEEMKGAARRTMELGTGPGAIVVFWHGDAEAAIPFRAGFDGQALTFSPSSEGYVDRETGSTWRLDGLAVSGPLEGRRLTPVATAYVAFWFAWADFHPETWVWSASGGE
ncbi:MAG: DUF3179 domain-containing protein [Gemmatimonadota bacterium]|nr:DUF3179 domain-containing protein [Gemmatimonadota bacterium]